MVNVAVVGFGYWGPNLVRNFNQVPDADLVAVCDLRADRLAKVRRIYPHVRATRAYQNLLDDPDIDAIVLATPASTHYPLGLEALRHGKHLLVEKPMAISSEEAEELIELAGHYERVLMVGHTFEYHPAVNKVKELLVAGEVGDVYYISSERVNLGLHQPDVDVIWDVAPHDLSIIVYWLQQEPIIVSAQASAYIQRNFVDVAFLTLEFPNGILAHIHVSWLSPSKLRRTTVVGDAKMIVYDDLENVEKVRVYDYGVINVGNHSESKEFLRQYRIGDVYSPFVENAEPLQIEGRHFVECIRKGIQPRSDGHAGLRVLRLVEAAERSLRRNGQRVRVEPVQAAVDVEPMSALAVD